VFQKPPQNHIITVCHNRKKKRMDNSNILFLEKIIHLGKRLEKNRIYELLEPWMIDGYNSIEIQNAGKKISNFIGLSNLTFVITYTTQEKNVAGHIELNNNSDEGVFIEIDEKFKSEPEIILAILAHEICHKLIYINGLSQFGHENEILTDIATIYMGLGKLSLNGCEIVNISTNTQWSGDERKTTTSTTTQKVGYLSRSQFAFVYKIICEMRRIPNNYAITGLNGNALEVLNRVYFNIDDNFFYNDFALKEVNETLKKANHDIHLISALNTKLSKTIQSNIELVNETNRTIHKKIKSTSKKYIDKANEKLKPESLNFVKNLLLIDELEKLERIYKNEEREIISINSQFLGFLFKQNENGIFPIKLNNREALYNIKCPVCQHSMRLKQDKLVKIKCLKCKYSFIIDNTPIEHINSDKSTTPTKKSIKQKFKEIISILKQ